MSRQSLERTIEVAAAKLAVLEQYGEDVYPNGTVIRFRIRYQDGPQLRYRFAAIKANGRWWVTGRAGLTNLTWDDLINLWTQDGRKVSKIQVATGWLPLGWQEKGSTTDGDIRVDQDVLEKVQADVATYGAGYFKVASDGQLVRILPDFTKGMRIAAYEEVAERLDNIGSGAFRSAASYIREWSPK